MSAGDACGSANHSIVSIGLAEADHFLRIARWPGDTQVERVNVTVEEKIVLDGPFVGSDWAVVMLPIHLGDCSSQQRIEIA
ncbi:hypothetical protein LYZ86_24395, partial [Xanthomonas hortorum pv. cynarae]|uniref:hypothetical protein n=1 Tax=Xanthomonas hortorum TaxID=56454 RepID=UPI001F34EF54